MFVLMIDIIASICVIFSFPEKAQMKNLIFLLRGYLKDIATFPLNSRGDANSQNYNILINSRGCRARKGPTHDDEL